MSFDPMAAAIDWLDAYRAGDLDAILKMHADDAVIHCGCGTMKTVSGEEALRAYWMKRLEEYPASDLDNVHPLQDGSIISYVTCKGVVDARLRFNAAGHIASIDCAPAGRPKGPSVEPTLETVRLPRRADSQVAGSPDF